MKEEFDSDCKRSYLRDLSFVESNHSVLYTALADRVNIPSAKSLLYDFARAHSTHSAMLNGIIAGATKTKVELQANEKEFSEVFGLAYDIYKDVIKKEEIPEEELYALAKKLSILENALKEKYLSEQLKRVNSDDLRSLFEKTINNIAHHLQLLGTLKTQVDLKEHGQTVDAVVIGCLPPPLTTPLPHNP